MVNAGILNGDLVLVKEQHNASNGEMVVALIGRWGCNLRHFTKKMAISDFSQRTTMDPIDCTRCYDSWQSNQCI